MNIIVTCEHGGNKIPKKYLSFFKDKKRILNTHRGWDQGALVLAKKIARDLSAPLFYSEISRLLIDLNRSLHHPGLFSEFSKSCNATIKQELIGSLYIPYRSEIENRIKNLTSTGKPLIHFSIHTFTPVLNGLERNADISFLYDPEKIHEKALCDKLRTSLKNSFPDLTIRSNYPYRGNTDGFTTYLRHRFNEKIYLGIEIEINQKHIITNNPTWLMIKQRLGRFLLNNIE